MDVGQFLIQLLLLAAGFVLLVKGADWFVEGSSSVAKLLKGTVVRDPWFRKMMRIDDAKTYAKGLVRILVENGTIKYAGKDGYCLPEKKEEK